MGGIKFLGDPTKGPVVFGIPAVRIWTCVVGDPRRVRLSPCINLIYHLPALAAMLFITREMEQQKLLPRVYSWRERKDAVYVAVLFHLKRMPLTFLQKFASRQVAHAAEKQLDETFELIAISEAEIPTRDMQPFFKVLERKKQFWLYLSEADPPQIDPLWRMRLEHLIRREPRIKGEILD